MFGFLCYSTAKAGTLTTAGRLASAGTRTKPGTPTMAVMPAIAGTPEMLETSAEGTAETAESPMMSKAARTSGITGSTAAQETTGT